MLFLLQLCYNDNGDRVLKELEKQYDLLQLEYGDKSLHSIYNGGCDKKPDLFFVFMNPTGKNIASLSGWKGIRSPWIGTKNIWTLFYQIGLLDEDIYLEIRRKKGKEWDEVFAKKVYDNVKKHKYFITNLGKCTQIDARPLPDSVYKQYLELLFKEIDIVKPKKIITFGNQVSSILLNQKISVSSCRKQKFLINVNDKKYDVYPVYYPIGNGIFNIDKAIEDLKYIINQK